MVGGITMYVLYKCGYTHGSDKGHRILRYGNYAKVYSYIILNFYIMPTLYATTVAIPPL